MSQYDAVAVFGSKMTDGTFPQFVYMALDRAVILLEEGATPWIVFCGSHAYNQGVHAKKEWREALRYMHERYPRHVSRFLTERASTSVVENWLYLRARFPQFRNILLVTIEPLKDRMAFSGDWIYGDYGKLSFEALPWPAHDFPDDASVLARNRCILTVYKGGIGRGDYDALLDSKGASLWQTLRLEHRDCCARHG